MNFHFVETGKEQEDPPLADLLLHKVIYIYFMETRNGQRIKFKLFKMLG